MLLDLRSLKTNWKAKGLSSEEIGALEVMYDRAKFANRYFRDGKKHWSVRDYQKESLNWYGPRKIHRSARSTGKTKDLEICAINIAMMDPGEEMLIGTQRHQHLEPLMERLIRMFTTDPELKACLLRNPQRSPDYKIELKNGFIIWGRIAGPFGQNFQSMHVKYQFCEEAQEWTEKAWREFIPGLNPGGWRWVWGVPNGVRNKFYDLTEDPDYKLFSWSRLMDKSVTPKEIEELKRFYGGEASPDYQHMVLGIHGKRRFSTFDFEDYQACVKAYRCPNLILTAEMKKDAGPGWREKLLSFPINPFFKGEYGMGCDIGFTTDPTEIVGYVFDGKMYQNIYRIRLINFKLNEQREAIEFLDSRYPNTWIGLDRAGIGLGLEHELKAASLKMAQTVNGFYWGSNVMVGETADYKEDIRESRSFATFLIEENMRNRTIIFPVNEDREAQYVNMTHESKRNMIVYSESENHLVDADRCALLASYLTRLQKGDEIDIGVNLQPIVFGGGR